VDFERRFDSLELVMSVSAMILAAIGVAIPSISRPLAPRAMSLAAFARSVTAPAWIPTRADSPSSASAARYSSA